MDRSHRSPSLSSTVSSERSLEMAARSRDEHSTRIRSLPQRGSVAARVLRPLAAAGSDRGTGEMLGAINRLPVRHGGEPNRASCAVRLARADRTGLRPHSARTSEVRRTQPKRTGSSERGGGDDTHRGDERWLALWLRGGRGRAILAMEALEAPCRARKERLETESYRTPRAKGDNFSTVDNRPISTESVVPARRKSCNFACFILLKSKVFDQFYAFSCMKCDR